MLESMGSDSIDMKLRVKLHSIESKRGRRDYCLFPPSPFEVIGLTGLILQSDDARQILQVALVNLTGGFV